MSYLALTWTYKWKLTSLCQFPQDTKIREDTVGDLQFTFISESEYSASWIKLPVIAKSAGGQRQHSHGILSPGINSQSLREGALTPQVVERPESPQDCSDSHPFLGKDQLPFVTEESAATQ